MDGTLVSEDSSPGRVGLRLDAVLLLRALRNAGCRLAIWTAASREWMAEVKLALCAAVSGPHACGASCERTSRVSWCRPALALQGHPPRWHHTTRDFSGCHWCGFGDWVGRSNGTRGPVFEGRVVRVLRRVIRVLPA